MSEVKAQCLPLMPKTERKKENAKLSPLLFVRREVKKNCEMKKNVSI
jgi:hypothetical protein